MLRTWANFPAIAPSANTRAASGTRSRRRGNNTLAAAALLALAASAHPCRALAGDGYSFALNLQRFTQTLHVELQDVDTINERIGIEIWETAHSNLLLGVTLGQLFITQHDFPTASGDDFDGFYGELAMTHPVVRAGPLELAATAVYGYHQAVSATSDNEIHFHTLAVDGGARLPLSGALTLLTTISYGSLRGDEITTMPRTHYTLEESQHTSVGLGLELNVDPGGYVTLRAEHGARSGVSLSFSRRY